MPESHGRSANRKRKPTEKPAPPTTEPRITLPIGSPIAFAPKSPGQLHDSLRKFGGRIRSAIPLFLTWAATILAIASGAVVLLPRVTVDSSGPYDPLHPHPVIFTIANTNIVPLHYVKIGISICYLEASPVTKPEICPPSAYGKILDWQLQWLLADEKYQIALEDMINLGSPTKNTPRQFENANIAIDVIYTPWYLPSIFEQERQFRFVTIRRSDGDVYWMPLPLYPGPKSVRQLPNVPIRPPSENP